MLQIYQSVCFIFLISICTYSCIACVFKFLKYRKIVKKMYIFESSYFNVLWWVVTFYALIAIILQLVFKTAFFTSVVSSIALFIFSLILIFKITVLLSNFIQKVYDKIPERE